jgi:glutathione S-transferase
MAAHVAAEGRNAMIKLNGFRPLWNLPDLSPFVTKVDAYLRLRSLPYTMASYPFFGLGSAPKGKLPFIEDGDQSIGDSTFIVEHLERRHGPGLDARLSPAARAVAHAMQRMIEENLYWVLVQLRWRIDDNWERFMAELFGAWRENEELSNVLPRVREGVLGQLHGHGMGRHSVDEVWGIGVRDVDALSAYLADKPFLMGEAPTSVDASAHAFLSHLTVGFASPVEERIRSHANLGAYAARMNGRLYESKRPRATAAGAAQRSTVQP